MYGITVFDQTLHPPRQTIAQAVSEISTRRAWKSDDGAGKVGPCYRPRSSTLLGRRGHRGRPICRSNNWTRNRITFILITRRGQATKRNARSEVGSALLLSRPRAALFLPGLGHAHTALRSSLPLRFDSFSVQSSSTIFVESYNRGGQDQISMIKSVQREMLDMFHHH